MSSLFQSAPAPLLRKRDVPVIIVKDLDNAAMLAPEKYEIGRELLSELVSKRELKKLQEAKSPHGVILRDPEFWSDDWKTIHAHEMGHAQIRRDGGLHALNQRFGGWLSPLGAVAGIGSALYMPHTAYGQRNPWAGPTLAAALAALGAVPTLINEHKAHEVGKRFYPKYDEKLKRKALATYYTGAGATTLMAGAMGLMANRLSKSASVQEPTSGVSANDWRGTTLGTIADEAARQMPRFHSFEAGMGGLAGLLGGYLYHKGKGWLGKEKFRNPEHAKLALLKRVLAGGAIGAVGSNIVGDRLRRYISNSPVPFGYEADGPDSFLGALRAAGWKGFVQGALKDEVITPPGTDKNIDLAFRSFGRPVRRELLRRGFNVHHDKPETDFFKVTGRGADGADVLGIADRFFDKNHRMIPTQEAKNLWDELRPNTEDFLEASKVTGTKSPAFSQLFRNFTGRRFGDTMQWYDRWDFDLHDDEKEEAKGLANSLIKRLFRAPASLADEKQVEKLRTLASYALRYVADKSIASRMPYFHQSFYQPNLATQEPDENGVVRLGAPYRIPQYGE